MSRIRIEPMEWLIRCSPEGRPLEKVSRGQCHDGTKILHPVIHLQIIDKEGRFLLQKRSCKKQIQPGKWDTSVGGHVSWGETFYQALKRESLEEIGFFPSQALFKTRYIWESSCERELVSLYIADYRGETVCFDPEEIEETRFWEKEEILEKRPLFSENLLYELHHFFSTATLCKDDFSPSETG